MSTPIPTPWSPHPLKLPDTHTPAPPRRDGQALSILTAYLNRSDPTPEEFNACVHALSQHWTPPMIAEVLGTPIGTITTALNTTTKGPHRDH